MSVKLPNKNWLLSVLEQSIGKVAKDRSLILKAGQRPDGTPKCPGCAKGTRWRGPHPRVQAGVGGVSHTPDPPLTHKGRVATVQMPARGGMRTVEADRLYAMTDRWTDGPMPLNDGRLKLWQPALCGDCEMAHKLRWFDVAFPHAAPVEESSESSW
jgi:hypothetical protein